MFTQTTVIYSDGENLKTNRILRKWMGGRKKFVAIIEGDSLITKKEISPTSTKKVSHKPPLTFPRLIKWLSIPVSLTWLISMIIIYMDCLKYEA